MKYVSIVVTAVVLTTTGCGAMDFVNYTINSYHETQESFDRRHGEGSHDLLLQGRIECCMCDGTGVCAKCEGTGCIYCNGSGVCLNCEGKGYTQQIDAPSGLEELDKLLDIL